MNIVLCGMMGCGKTTVAAQLEKHGYTVVDTDSVIVERYGSIADLFAKRGEEYFREIETRITAEIAKNYSDAVISTGGGCVLRKENVKNLKAGGKIIYLRARAETLIKRLQGDASRPLLQGGLEERVNGILNARAAVYERVADHIIDTDELTALQVAEKIREINL